MRNATYGAVMVVAVLGFGATCVDSGPMESSSVSPGPSDATSPDDAPSDDDEEERPAASGGSGATDVGTTDDHSRATFTSGFDLTALRSEIIRTDGTIEDVGDEELFLYPRNRARIFITASNQSDGEAPINFELCTDNYEALTVLNAEAVEGPLGDPSEDYSEDSELARQPCRVRFAPGEWPIIERGASEEFLTGAVLAYPHPAGGYLTIRFRVEFVELGEMDLYEYTVPYRVLPSGQAKATFVPRHAVLRRLVVDLP